MKNHLFLIVLLSSNICLTAQNGLEINPDSFEEIYLDVDLTNNWEDLLITSFMTNTSDTTMSLAWTRLVSPDCPSEWEFYIADKDLSYPPHIETSPLPLTFAVGETDAIFVLHVLPRSTAGCCELDVVFSEFDNPSVSFDTIHYTIQINDEFCFVTNTRNLTDLQTTLEVSPNPVYNTVAIASTRPFDEIILFNALGRPVFKKQFTTSLDVKDLDTGLYILQTYQKGELVGINKLIKQ